MALQTSGQMKLSEIAVEFGGTGELRLSDYYGKDIVPASGQISFNNFYGASDVPPVVNQRVSTSSVMPSNVSTQNGFEPRPSRSHPQYMTIIGTEDATNQYVISIFDTETDTMVGSVNPKSFAPFTTGVSTNWFVLSSYECFGDWAADDFTIVIFGKYYEYNIYSTYRVGLYELKWNGSTWSCVARNEYFGEKFPGVEVFDVPQTYNGTQHSFEFISGDGLHLLMRDNGRTSTSNIYDSTNGVGNLQYWNRANTNSNFTLRQMSLPRDNFPAFDTYYGNHFHRVAYPTNNFTRMFVMEYAENIPTDNLYHNRKARLLTYIRSGNTWSREASGNWTHPMEIVTGKPAGIDEDDDWDWSFYPLSGGLNVSTSPNGEYAVWTADGNVMVFEEYDPSYGNVAASTQATAFIVWKWNGTTYANEKVFTLDNGYTYTSFNTKYPSTEAEHNLMGDTSKYIYVQDDGTIVVAGFSTDGDETDPNVSSADTGVQATASWGFFKTDYDSLASNLSVYDGCPASNIFKVKRDTSKFIGAVGRIQAKKSYYDWVWPAFTYCETLAGPNQDQFVAVVGDYFTSGTTKEFSFLQFSDWDNTIGYPEYPAVVDNGV